MNTAPITLPSGLGCEIRRLQTKEIDIMADPDSSRSHDLFDRIFSAVTVGIFDVPSFYSMKDVIKPTELLVGDRTALLYYLRRWTYGDVIEFDWTCGNCKALNKSEGDLSSLVVKPLPAESLIVLTQQDGVFSTKVPDSGARVEFKLLRGFDERMLAKLQKVQKQNLFTALLNYRVISIDGQRPSPKLIETRLEGYDADWLRQHWEEVDCGVETSTSITCSECRASQEIDIPFGGKGFWKAPKKLTRTLETRNTGDESLHMGGVSQA